MKYYLAIDLGATSGRHIVSYMEDGEIKLDEVYRFPTGMKPSNDGLVWEHDVLFGHIKEGIKEAFKRYKNIKSLSIDTWGVDYVLLNGNTPLKPYFAYRNERTLKRIDEVHSVIPFEKLYEKTGTQFATFNTLYQLYDDLKEGRLDKATDFLFLPQYYSFLLTGNKALEYTEASTTGMLNCFKKEFDEEIIDKLGLPKKLFKELKDPGYCLGCLKEDIVNEVGGNTEVILCPSHDTASAFEAVDCPKDAVIISSGTWSLVGVKSLVPNTTKKAHDANFTNEGGVGYIRFLKNIMGMWLVNEVCRQKNLNVVEICQKLDNVKYDEVFDVNDSSLAAPENMETAIRNLLKNNPPKDDLELFKSIYLSLAHSYKKAVKEIEDILGEKYNYIYIVGGGAKNKFLNKLTEEISEKKVVALPIEATALGNIKCQMKVK